jgi:hypothetical protein
LDAERSPPASTRPKREFLSWLLPRLAFAVVLPIALVVWCVPTPWSEEKKVAAELQSSLLDLRLKADGKSLASLVAPPIAFESDTSCLTSWRNRFSRTFHCRSSRAKLTDGRGQVYSFRIGGGFLGRTFLPADPPAIRLFEELSGHEYLATSFVHFEAYRE